MSLPENYVTVSHHNFSPIDENRNYSSLPASGRLCESKIQRNVEDFLTKIVPNSNPINDIENNSDSITLKENSRHSSLLFDNESEIPIDLEDDNSRVSIHHDHNINTSHEVGNQSNTPLLDIMNEELIKSPKMSIMNSIENNAIQFENDHEKIATPTIKFSKHSNHLSNDSTGKNEEEFDKLLVLIDNITFLLQSYLETDFSLSNNAFFIQLHQKSPDYQEFILKLTEMSSLLLQKDDEIKKLSQKLIEIETKNKSHGKSSSSSDESDESSKEKPISKKNKKDKDKCKDKSKKKKQSAKKDKKEKISKPNEEKNISLEKSIEIPNVSLPQENQSNLDPKNNPNFSTFNLNGNENLKSVSSDNFTIDRDKLTPDLRKKLGDLESEVRRLQQANIDSILTLQKLEDNTASSSHLSNDTVINQLLVDHNLLKEELQQLKWEHAKLTQVGLLAEEINQLKKDMKFLKSFTKKSSKSLNHLASSSFYDRNFKETIDPKITDRKIFVSNIPDSNGNSNYIYQKLQNQRKPMTETPSVHKMLKSSIESLESPYHTTCQNIQHSVPFSGSPTYRARKISDSSSALIEDIKPKSWIEPIPNNYNYSYQLLPNELSLPFNDSHNKDFDVQSVDSYVSVTTSVTEKSEDNWQSTNKNYNENNGDFLSTLESESSEVSTVKNTENYTFPPRYEYSFTPKVAKDLHLDDVVKFVRPGGKMATGTVCFIGHLPGRSEVCVGLELGEEAGKHDGLFEGHRYFQCRKNRGVFISFHKIILAYKSL